VSPFALWGPAAGGVPVGHVVPYAGPAAATDSGDGVDLAQIAARLAAAGWLLCDGRELDRHDYPQLHGVIGTAFGGDGAAGTFRLPDLRGRFARGVDGGAGHDPDAGQRRAPAAGGASGDRVGSLQLDAFQGHEHHYTATQETGSPAEAGEAPTLAPLPDQATKGEVADSGYGQPRVAAETRPVNLALNHLIRYR